MKRLISITQGNLYSDIGAIPKIKQNDDTMMAITLLGLNGAPYYPDRVTLIAMRSDKTRIVQNNNITINGNVVTIVLDPRTVALTGNVSFEVKCLKDGNLISTFIFPIQVDPEILLAPDAPPPETIRNALIAAVNAPYIGANGNWYVYDNASSAFVDSGIFSGTTIHGLDGAAWYWGVAAPTVIFSDGDWYVDTAAWDVYRQETGAWELKGNIKGVDGADGADGKNLEFTWSGTRLGVRTQGSPSYSYSDLQGIQGIQGVAGRTMELQLYTDFTDPLDPATYIQWRYIGDANWQNLLELPDTVTGVHIEFRVDVPSGGVEPYIQWRQGGGAWNNLIALSAITGADGTDGLNGADGKNVELQVTSTHIQWRNVGDASWQNLVALTSITGATGAAGTSVNAILAQDEATATTLSTQNPNNVYYWV